MVATVLVGKARGGAGVVATLFNIGDETNPQYGRDARIHEVRQQAVNQWAQLPSSPIPAVGTVDGAETIFKVSRHRVSGAQTRRDDIWTFVGCYAGAQYAGNVRGNTYVGAGVLTHGRAMPARQVVHYTMSLLWRMIGAAQGGILAESPSEMDLPISPTPFETAPWSGSGMSPTGTRRVFIDLSGFPDKDSFDDNLLALLDQAQRHPAFEDVSELLLGNSTALAAAARSSRRFEVFTPGEWQTRAASFEQARTKEAQPPPVQQQQPPSSSQQSAPVSPAVPSHVFPPDSRPSSAREPSHPMWGPPIDRSHGDWERVAELEHRTQSLADKARYRDYLILGLVVVVIALAAVLAFPQGLGTGGTALNEGPAADDQAQASVDPATAAAENPSDLDKECPPSGFSAAQPPASDAERKAIEDEIKCLQDGIRPRYSRAKALETLLKTPKLERGGETEPRRQPQVTPATSSSSGPRTPKIRKPGPITKTDSKKVKPDQAPAKIEQNKTAAEAVSSKAPPEGGKTADTSKPAGAAPASDGGAKKGEASTSPGS